jgi:Acyl-CoA-binding protein
MTEIKERFDLSVKMSSTLDNGVSNEELLKLYAFYKQSNFGNCNTKQPSSFNLKESAKWSAWSKLKNMTPAVAMNKYSDLILQLFDKYGTK